jgi:hypothetical protein
VYYGLNQIGAEIWDLLPPSCQTVTELCSKLEQRFEGIDPPSLRADVVALLADLLANNLVAYPDQERADAGTSPETDRQTDTPQSG